MSTTQLVRLAPEGLLNFISCKCEKGCRGKCSCIMNGIKCVPACSHCKGVLCENVRSDALLEDIEVDSDNEG